MYQREEPSGLSERKMRKRDKIELEKRAQFKVRRGFTGYYLPQHILFVQELKMIDKNILALVHSMLFKGNRKYFTGSNEYLSNIFSVSPGTITSSIKRLKRLEFIRIVPSNGRARRIQYTDKTKDVMLSCYETYEYDCDYILPHKRIGRM